MTLSSRERLAKRIRALRLQKGWSQEYLADASGLHRTYIGTVERSEQSMTVDTIDKLAKALEVNVSELFSD
jgi:transcriptional regulator with XRE-family HTH domain